MVPSPFSCAIQRLTLRGCVTCLLIWVLFARVGTAEDDHWAFVAPHRAPVPAVADADWPRNPLDRFVLARLDDEGLVPAPEADRETLIRRVTLALTGLPPTLEEIDAFLADTAPNAYERLVERLLASPRYGEHLASLWLDLARYADTHGYHMDAHREMWPWRDGLIDALNAGQPYDQFTIEQLAGDLLPDATQAQQIASGFNRNNMVNFEAGAIPDEFLVEYAADRVAVTSTVWLGLTMQCCRCHDHKYEPLTQRDFYRMLAFFNQVPEKGIDGDRGNAEPTVAAPSRVQRQQLEQLGQRIADLRGQLAAREADCDAAMRAWEQTVLGPSSTPERTPDDMVLHLPFESIENQATREAVAQRDVPVDGGGLVVPAKLNRGLLFGGDTRVVLDADAAAPAAFDTTDACAIAVWVFPTTADRMTVVAKLGVPPKYRGWYVELVDGRVAFGINSDATNNRLRVVAMDPLEQRQWQHVVAAYDGSSRASGVALFVDGQRQTLAVEHDDLDGASVTQQPLRIGHSDEGTPFRGMLDDLRVYGRSLSATEAGVLAGGDPIRAIVATPIGERTESQSAALRDFYLRHHDVEHQRLTKALNAAVEARERLLARVPTAMVMRDAASPRTTFLLQGGRYDQPGEAVAPGIPAALGQWSDAEPRDRLGLARWLVDPRHPLTARVAVNRLWQHVFGQGLVATPEDFGSRGEPPTHPQLLDWLAVELVESGWDTKRLHAMMVTSATFRQSSRTSRELQSRDPANRLLARGPRIRLSAEAIRDGALAIGGLLVERQGGPPVFPYQPPGLWEELAYDVNEFTAQAYAQSHGADLYRRSLYTFWKRGSPPPTLTLLGAPTRETCTVRRATTNTPVEALVLMNETGLIEAARGFAARMLEANAESDRERIVAAFRRATSRRPTQREQQLLLSQLHDQREFYRNDPRAAGELLGVGESRMTSDSGDASDVDAAELAAWTMLANTLLCIDETISRN